MYDLNISCGVLTQFLLLRSSDDIINETIPLYTYFLGFKVVIIIDTITYLCLETPYTIPRILISNLIR